MTKKDSSIHCHNWVTSALGGRAEEISKQSNYVLFDLIVCYFSRPARGCLINSNGSLLQVHLIQRSLASRHIGTS